jgi:predicted flap endonuclease-1-like 5' DNA nuclease
MAATSGRTYELTFHGWARTEARAEVLWRAESGATLRIDALPIDRRARAVGGTLEPSLHRGRFTAPAGTIAAEVRFVVEEGIALLRDASFREPANALAAGDLRGAFATVWTQQPAAAPGFRIAAAGSGSQVGNAGAGPVTLRQEVAAIPGAPFELRLRGRLESGPSPLLELRFLGADEVQMGEAVALEMAAHGFDHALALGTVPAGTARAEVVLAVPPGSSSRIEAIELLLAPNVRLPLTFLAEAPGELSVVGGVIAWDLAAGNPRGPAFPSPRPRPNPTETPLPEPTPPPGAPDDCGCEGETPTVPAADTPALRQASAEPLAIKGIGPRRAAILRSRGMATAAALLAADPRELARVLPGVSEKMAVEFIRQARVLAG